MPVDYLEGPGGAALLRLYKTTKKGLQIALTNQNYEVVLALLQTLNPKPSSQTLNPKPSSQTLNPKPSSQTLNPKFDLRESLTAKWIQLRNEAYKQQEEYLLQQLLLLLQQRQQIASRCGYSCWAEMRLRRQTAEGDSWRDVALLLRSIGNAAAKQAPPQLLKALKQQQQQQQQQQGGRLTVDQWLAAAMQVLGFTGFIRVYRVY